VQTKAQAKFVRVSARKARLVTDLIKGKDLADAQQTLDYCEKGAAHIVSKVLNSAAANAENNHGLSIDSLYVLNAYVDEGPTLKRFRPRAMGRATRINKRTSHITVVLEEREPEKVKPRRFRRPMGKGALRKAAEKAAAAEEAEKEAAQAEEELTEAEELEGVSRDLEEPEELIEEETEEAEVEEAEAEVEAEEKVEEVEGEEEPAGGEPEDAAGESSDSKKPAEDAGTGEE